MITTSGTPYPCIKHACGTIQVKLWVGTRWASMDFGLLHAMLECRRKSNLYPSHFIFRLCAWHSRAFACSLLCIVLYPSLVPFSRLAQQLRWQHWGNAVNSLQ